MRHLRLLLLCFVFSSSCLLAAVPATVAVQTNSHTANTPAASAQLLDLNTATPAQLKALPGIGDAYAKRIIEGRPYTAKNQLVTRGVLPQATYDRIRDQIIAHRPAK